MSLDQNQIKAVEFDKGPALIIAGPGSGKTTVLTKRVAYLIEQRNVSPHRILVITFTKSAALQMKERFLNITNCFYPVTFCTFHSLFYSIIRESVNNHYSIISPEEKLNIIKESLLYNGIDIDLVNIQALADEFSKINNSHVNLHEFISLCLPKEDFIKVYVSYIKEKNSLMKIDYDDFAYLALDILKDRNTLNRWKNMYDYLLIDEFQDINSIQYELIKTIFNENIYAVGDEDQSIYGFRGSSPEICFRFVDEFNAKKFYLTNNYRSFSEIVSIASMLIKNNKNRFDKDFNANKFDNKEHVFISKFNNYENMYKEMAQKIKESLNNKESTVILARTNSITPVFLKELDKCGIDIDRDNCKCTVNKEILKDICTYMKMAFGELNISNLLRIYNKPNRYISRAFIDDLNIIANEEFTFTNALKAAKGKNYIVKALFVLEKNLSQIKAMDSYQALIFILKVIGYEDYLKKTKKQYDEDIKIIKEYAREFKDIKDFIENVELIDGIEIKANKKRLMVEYTTMHSSKGLEWDNVFIADLQEGIIPHKRCSTIHELEEERRLLYVAMTRARKRLWLGFVENEKAGILPSIFIEEIS